MILFVSFTFLFFNRLPLRLPSFNFHPGASLSLPRLPRVFAFDLFLPPPSLIPVPPLALYRGWKVFLLKIKKSLAVRAK